MPLRIRRTPPPPRSRWIECRHRLSARRRRAAWIAGLVLAAPPLGRSAEPQVWIDAEGVTHIADHASAVPENARPGEGRQALRGLWDGVVEPPGPVPARPPDATSSHEDRARRVIRGAVEDL